MVLRPQEYFRLASWLRHNIERQSWKKNDNYSLRIRRCEKRKGRIERFKDTEENIVTFVTIFILTYELIIVLIFMSIKLLIGFKSIKMARLYKHVHTLGFLFPFALIFFITFISLCLTLCLCLSLTYTLSPFCGMLFRKKYAFTAAGPGALQVFSDFEHVLTHSKVGGGTFTSIHSALFWNVWLDGMGWDGVWCGVVWCTAFGYKLCRPEVIWKMQNTPHCLCTNFVRKNGTCP